MFYFWFVNNIKVSQEIDNIPAISSFLMDLVWSMDFSDVLRYNNLIEGY